MKLILGDCLDKLKELDESSVDSVVTDPPYELGFMGKAWDSTGIAYNSDLWSEVLRVLKPGGHLLAFGGSRTYHRMVVAIEDAGFEVRDQIMWIYSSGFPKGMNLSTKLSNTRPYDDTTPLDATPDRDDATNWDGWATALKPAHEPIVLARKPISEKTVADNVLKYGTGALNIDACRIPVDYHIDKSQLRVITRSKKDQPNGWGMNSTASDVTQVTGHDFYKHAERYKEFTKLKPEGRWPANIMFDEYSGELLDYQCNTPGGAARFFYCPTASYIDRCEGLSEFDKKKTLIYRINENNIRNEPANPKENTHPTVKPTDLMCYLIRLVTPPGGIVLDPFMGSGSTGKAAVRGGFDFIGIEREEEYFEISNARIDYEVKNPFIEEKNKRVILNENSSKFFSF